ncbi:MAG TPA: bi-domain-containing oxidoreductase [Candidatus Limnocylindrales bacterium]|nr:bi-domain-containing oxidoreductase [Candidatus Limnocylindrales bacterium]
MPDPVAAFGQVVIATEASVISAGTEKMVRDLARKSLLQKARERPEQVRRVLEKLRQEGLASTVRQVRGKLSEPVPLGYSSAGTVIACGPGVQGVRPGDRVASNGPHAEITSVPRNLCAAIPEGVATEDAAFAVLGAISLQGVRLAEVRIGETAFVIGLGLLGQITTAILHASGVRVIGTDPDPSRCALALRMGADVARTELGASSVAELTGGLGADSVLVTAGTPSDGPIALAGEAVRKKGRVVVVGAVGMNVPRPPYFEKEAELVVSCSYGPGRYDPVYEEQGRDYPPAYVRWTEQRNLQAVLDLMATGRLDVAPLITHRFELSEAEAAYRLIDGGEEPFLGVVLRYPGLTERVARRRIDFAGRPAVSADGRVGVGVIGTGGFARAVLIPAIEAASDLLRPEVLCSARGLSAADAAQRSAFRSATSDETAVYDEARVGAVVIATRHDLHATQAARAIAAGKHVFVEKPLALDLAGLSEVEAALASCPGAAPILMVGFNRRFSPAAARTKEHFAGVRSPLTVSFRFNAGFIDPAHWTQDLEVGGGRIIGEACHAIDLVTYLVGSPPVRVYAESIGGPAAPAVTDDQCFITLRHADGSVSSIAYLAGGDRAFSKERVEVFGGGRVAVIEDFREVITAAGGRTKRHRALQQDKGHRSEIRRFAEAVARGTAPPIPWEDLRAVSLAAILAVRSLREGVPFEVPSG